jgi:hypothetical protein
VRKRRKIGECTQKKEMHHFERNSAVWPGMASPRVPAPPSLFACVQFLHVQQ